MGEGTMNGLKYWVGFNRISGVGPVRLRRLLEHFGDLESAWRAGPGELRQAGLEPKICEAVVARRPTIDLDREMERLHRYGVRVLTWEDPSYPPRLREVYDASPVLYVRGSLLPGDEAAIAVVGTRRASAYGRQVTEELVGDLARNGITIVSGLAKGIDAAAHRAALAVGGRTLAVLACGLDLVYPSDHLPLARQILEHGALLSDYPLGMRPMATNFPMRNRIISGLSLGVLMIEGGNDSGALITARLALEQNREVFAVPGSIYAPTSQGTNRLIRQGEAKLVLNAQDILEELNLSLVGQQLELKELVPAGATEAVVLKHLGAEPRHIDEISRQCGLPIATVSSTLAMMELKGMVKQLGAMNFARAREVRAEYLSEG